MTKDEYWKSIQVGARCVDIGVDNAGQQMFAQWVDDDGNTQEISFGAYNMMWVDDLAWYMEHHNFCGRACDKCELYVECKKQSNM